MEMGSDSQRGQEDLIEKLLEESYETRMRSHGSRNATVGNDDNNNDDPDKHGQKLLRLVPGYSMEMQKDGGDDSSMDGRATVLYKDYNGFLSPIYRAYYSQDLRSVVSSHPLSLCREAEVMYCPQLCGFYCVETEAHTSKGRCPRCYGCPVCGTALSISPTHLEVQQPSSTAKRGDSFVVTPSSWTFSCSYCMWSGAPQGLVAQDKETLVKLLAGDEARDLHTKVLNALIVGVRSQAAASSKAAREDRRMCVRPDGRGQGQLWEIESGGRNSSYSMNCCASGTMESLYENLAKREAGMNSERESLATVGLLAEDAPPLYTQQSEGSREDGGSGLGTAVKNAAASSGDDDGVGISQSMGILEGPTLPTLKMRLEQANSMRSSSETNLLSLKPQRLPLKVKCAKRCVKDANEGRTGLLVKPKANPEEGDSTGDRDGQWFKKDCSALYSIPEITIVPPIELDSIVLCITNPLDTPLTIHLMETSPLPEVVMMPPVVLLRCEINVIVKLAAKEDELLSLSTGFGVGVTEGGAAVGETQHEGDVDDGIGGKCPGILRSKGNTAWVRVAVNQQQNCNRINGENIIEGPTSSSVVAVAIDMHIESEEDDDDHVVYSTIIAWKSLKKEEERATATAAAAE